MIKQKTFPKDKFVIPDVIWSKRTNTRIKFNKDGYKLEYTLRLVNIGINIQLDGCRKIRIWRGI
jgi:hypothetical protein